MRHRSTAKPAPKSTELPGRWRANSTGAAPQHRACRCHWGRPGSPGWLRRPSSVTGICQNRRPGSRGDEATVPVRSGEERRPVHLRWRSMRAPRGYRDRGSEGSGSARPDLRVAVDRVSGGYSGFLKIGSTAGSRATVWRAVDSIARCPHRPWSAPDRE